MKANKRIFSGVILLAIFITACACPVSLPGLNPLKGIEATGLSIVSQIPQGLAETAEAYATKVDISPEEIAKTAEAGVATFIPNQTGTAPTDIPIVEGDVSMQIENPEMISYTIKKSAEDIKNFYVEKMPANGWSEQETNGLPIPGTTILNYTKADRKATITIIGVGDTTQVLIEISNP